MSVSVKDSAIKEKDCDLYLIERKVQNLEGDPFFKYHKAVMLIGKNENHILTLGRKNKWIKERNL